MRENRNCRNRKKLKHNIIAGRENWRQVSATLRNVLKIDDLKFFECPQSAITQKTWRILSLVHETTNNDGDILHMPFEGGILDQPPWYREAVRMVKRERAAHQKRKIEEARDGRR